MDTRTISAVGAAPPQPTNLPPLLEWSILSALAVWLVKQVWQHFSTADTTERESDRKLLIALVDDLRTSNREYGQHVATFSARISELANTLEDLASRSQQAERFKLERLNRLEAAVEALHRRLLGGNND